MKEKITSKGIKSSSFRFHMKLINDGDIITTNSKDIKIITSDGKIYVVWLEVI